jgi:hypothetical protein
MQKTHPPETPEIRRNPPTQSASKFLCRSHSSVQVKTGESIPSCRASLSGQIRMAFRATLAHSSRTWTIGCVT